MVLVWSLGEEVPPPDGPIHPRSANIVFGDVSATLPIDGRAPPRPDQVPSLLGTFVASKIGVLDGLDEEVFGRIRDLSVDESHRIAILDSQRRKISVFGRKGELLFVLAREGDGPGELRYPRAVSFGSRDSLYVFGARGRVSVFAPDGDSLRFAHAYQLEHELADACTLGDQIFVHGVRRGNGRAIQSYGPGGQLLASFGEVYRGGTPLIREQLTSGRLACLEDPPRVVLAPGALPVVRAFDTSGQPAWTVKLEGFAPIHAYRTPRESILQVPESGYHVNRTLTPSPDGRYLILQIAHMTRESRQNQELYARLQTFLISGDGSGGVYLGDDWAPVFASTPSGLFTVEETPFPQVRVHTVYPGR